MANLSVYAIIKKMNNTNDYNLIRTYKREVVRRGYHAVYDSYVAEWILC